MDLFGPIAANDNDKRVCPNCSAPVTGHINRKFCSADCRHKSRSEKPGVYGHVCVGCSVEFTGRFDAKFCSKPCSRRHAEARKRHITEARRNAKQPVRRCEWCGDDYQKPNKGNEPRFCSKSCSLTHCNQEVYIKGILAGTHSLPSVSLTVYRPYCAGCGNRITARHGRTYCTDACRDTHSVGKWRQYAIANDNVDRTPRPCAECGDEFTPEYGSKRRSFCSNVCGKRNARRTKRKKERARLRGAVTEPVNPIKVFDRDGWVCQICGIDAPRDRRGTYEPDAPEMDHVIPLSKGGSHTYDNVQCACRDCNARKSDSLPVAA